MWLSRLGSSAAVSHSTDCRCGSDLARLRLWPKPAAAAPIQPLAWEPPSICHRFGPKKTKKEEDGAHSTFINLHDSCSALSLQLSHLRASIRMVACFSKTIITKNIFQHKTSERVIFFQSHAKTNNFVNRMLSILLLSESTLGGVSNCLRLFFERSLKDVSGSVF